MSSSVASGGGRGASQLLAPTPSQPSTPKQVPVGHRGGRRLGFKPLGPRWWDRSGGAVGAFFRPRSERV